MTSRDGVLIWKRRDAGLDLFAIGLQDWARRKYFGNKVFGTRRCLIVVPYKESSCGSGIGIGVGAGVVVGVAGESLFLTSRGKGAS